MKPSISPVGTLSLSWCGPLLLRQLKFLNLLQGQLRSETALSWSGNVSTRNLVQIWDNQFVRTGMDDAQSAVLTVAPSFNASLIGAGTNGAPLQPSFGNIDFKAYNINFQNRAVSFCALVIDFGHGTDDLLVVTGKLFDFSSSSDGYFICQRFVLRLYFRKLSGHMVHWEERQHLCCGQYHIWPNRL